MADCLLDVTGADELWMIVSPQNPFKNTAELAPQQCRLEMVQLAVKSAVHADRISVSGIEFELEKPSRTADTLRILSRNFPDKKFAVVIGSDNVDTFDLWKDFNYILDNYVVYVYPRDGYQPQNKELSQRFTYIKDVPLLPHAATDVRELIAHGGQNLTESIPTEVVEYIKKHKLYEPV